MLIGQVGPGVCETCLLVIGRLLSLLISSSKDPFSQNYDQLWNWILPAILINLKAARYFGRQYFYCYESISTFPLTFCAPRWRIRRQAAECLLHRITFLLRDGCGSGALPEELWRCAALTADARPEVPAAPATAQKLAPAARRAHERREDEPCAGLG
jgi:hypothetical protein